MSDRPTAVLVHGYAHHVWGSEKVALDTALAYRQGGWRVKFFLPGPGPFTDLVKSQGFPVRQVVSVPGGDPAWSWRLPPMARLAPALAGEKADLVHATSLGPVRALHWSCRLLKLPLAVQLQTPYTEQALAGGRLLAADLVLPVSREVMAPALQAVSRRGGRNVPEVHLLRPPVAVPDSGAGRRGRELRAAWKLGPDEKAVGMVGQIIPRKGVDLFLKACARLRREGLAARPVLIGGPPLGGENYLGEMRALAEKLGLGPCLITTGKVDDVSAHYHALDALAVPSRREGLGLVAGEAMLCGVPVVAALAGGLPELVLNDRTGLLFPVDDVPALAGALRRVLTDTALAGRLAETGRLHARRNYSRQRFALRLQTLAEAMIRVPALSPGEGRHLPVTL